MKGRLVIQSIITLHCAARAVVLLTVALVDCVETSKLFTTCYSYRHHIDLQQPWASNSPSTNLWCLVLP